MTDRIYLDWNATAPLRPEARAAMAAALDAFGQPVLGACRGPGGPPAWSNGRGNRSPRWSAAEAKLVTFTSGGTEANNLALTPAIQAGDQKSPATGS